MKKGLHIVCASGLVLAVSIAAIGCQRNTMETEKVLVETETIVELAENEDDALESVADEVSKKALDKDKKETEAKETKDAKKETVAKEDSKASTKKTSTKETSVKETSGTQKPSKPSETQKPSKPTETQPSKPTETQSPKPAETQPSKPAETQPVETQHKHTWVKQTKQVQHEAVGHYETVVIQAAWDEPIYETKVVCGCTAVFNNDYEWEQHSLDGCIYGYTVQSVQVGSKHHDAVTEQKWVEDKAAWTETVVTGYKCGSCGATKE